MRNEECSGTLCEASYAGAACGAPRPSSVPARPFGDPMSVTREDVLHVAALAKLRLGEEEIERMQRDLTRILGYVELLGELALDDVEPTAHVAVDVAPLRPDRIVPGLTTQAALSEAPRTLDGGFAVPAFVDEG